MQMKNLKITMSLPPIGMGDMLPPSHPALQSDPPAGLLVWKDLSVFEPNHGGCTLSPEMREEKRILKGINGGITHSSLNAIMGPSGAGKTTLLKCLFGTSTVKYTGDIYVCDKQTKAVFISQNEEDHLLLNLTVEESIRFASKIKNSATCNTLKKCIDSDLVQSLIDQLDLDRCRHTLVGKCSGGQKKRLAIAQELATYVKPKIIFMDEPTSGIDSSVSYLVLKQLQSLAQRNGIAILCTIHQPSYKILELFHQVYILSRRGRAIFSGRPQNLRTHLSRYSLACPNGHNPADVIIELASTETRRDLFTLEPGCFGFCTTVSTSRVREAPMTPANEILKIETLEKAAEIESEEYVNRLLMNPLMVRVRKLCYCQVPRTVSHVWYLLKRSLINCVLREPKWLLIRFLLHFLVALVLSFLYDSSIGEEDSCLSMGPKDSPSDLLCHCPTSSDAMSELKAENLAAKNVAFLFFNLMFLMFAALMPTVLTFPQEMKVFLNEHRNGWYNTRSYFWAKNCVEFLVQLPLPYIYSLYIFWWTNQQGLSSFQDLIPFLNPESRFNRFVSITLLSCFIAQGCGLLIGSIFTHNFNISIFVSTVFMMFNFLFSGFFIKISTMGSIEFLTKFSFGRFAFEALLVAIYGGRCPESTTSPTDYLPAVLRSRAALLSPSSTPMTLLMANAASKMNMTQEDVALMMSNNSTSAAFVTSPFMTTSSTNASPISIVSDVISTVLYQFDVEHGSFQRNCWWLLIHLIGWRVLSFLVLWWKANPMSLMGGRMDIPFPKWSVKQVLSSIIFLVTICAIVFSIVLICL